MLNKIVSIIQKIGPGLRQVISNTAWLFADKIGRMGLSLFVGVWVTRYLGPTQFGTLSYAMTFVSMFSAIASLGGLSSLIVRDIARNPSCKDESLGTAFTLQLIGGFLTILVTVAIIPILNPNDPLTHKLVAIIAAGTVFNAFGTIDFWFQSQLQSKYTIFAKNFAYLLVAAVRLVLIQLQAGLIDFAWARLAESAVGALGLLWVYRKQGNYIQAWRVSFQRSKELLVESFPLVLAGIAVYVYANIDQVMLGAILQENKDELGFYAAAVKLSTVFDFLPMILASSTLPKLTQLRGKNSEDYFKKLQIYFDISTASWLAIAIPVSILAPYIVPILYGEAFRASVPLLSVYAWSQFGSMFGVARGTFLAIEGKLHYSLIMSVMGAFLNIGLNYFMIPAYGAMGATVATLITYLFVIVLINFFIKDLNIVGLLILRSLNLYQAALRLKGLLR
ncbi:flippase [Limnofasciculus baicalensis]|uniref:Flippase n=1 Tax=Limnofasciculus baicalensis BBK-W-15 TaxID=2699891 RepID=A0AAE3KMW2_9CYAN|nr:flippase [Limnofasciculus baicalensis]MCP2729659.1 flippase [Limnofasciculus baicalensis BBK-W-15]